MLGVRTRYPARNIEGGDLIDLFLVSAVAAIAVTRLFLWATGYPQMGGGGLHIAHLLWGGLGMLIANCVLLLFVSRASRTVAAVLGGAGFGLFIDEIGKFITADNDYFFEPVAAIIYAIFVVLYVATRGIVQGQGYSARERLINAVELVKDAAVHDLDVRERQAALELLRGADHGNPLTEPLRQLLMGLPAEPIKRPWPVAVARRFGDAAADLIARPGVRPFVIAVLALFSALSLGLAVLDMFTDANRIADWIHLGAASAALALFFIGIGWRATSRLMMFRFIHWSLVVNLLLSQFFYLLSEQFSAYGVVFANLALVAVTRYLMHQHVSTKGSKSPLAEAISWRESIASAR